MTREQINYCAYCEGTGRNLWSYSEKGGPVYRECPACKAAPSPGDVPKTCEVLFRPSYTTAQAKCWLAVGHSGGHVGPASPGDVPSGTAEPEKDNSACVCGHARNAHTCWGECHIDRYDDNAAECSCKGFVHPTDKFFREHHVPADVHPREAEATSSPEKPEPADESPNHDPARALRERGNQRINHPRAVQTASSASPSARIPLGDGFEEAKERMLDEIDRSRKISGADRQQRIGTASSASPAAAEYECLRCGAKVTDGTRPCAKCRGEADSVRERCHRVYEEARQLAHGREGWDAFWALLEHEMRAAQDAARREGEDAGARATMREYTSAAQIAVKMAEERKAGRAAGRAEAFREAADLIWEWSRHGTAQIAEEWGEKLRARAEDAEEPGAGGESKAKEGR